MQYTADKRNEITENFIKWCDKIGYSGEDGVNVIIVDGLPIGIKRAVQSIRFDQTLTDGGQNTTME